MGAVAFVTRRRLARHWLALTAAGVLLGLGFGLCLASFAAARRTASAYDRILVRADAPDAAIAFGTSPGRTPEQSERSLRSIIGITGQRVYAGFLGSADGVDPILATALLAPIRDRFPIELPQLQRGRLPRAGAPDEALVNSSAAARGGLAVGQRLRFRFFNPATAKAAAVDITIVGIGTFPAEAVADETRVLGVFVFTRAFYEAHRDLVVYATSNVDLAPGFDARHDLAGQVGALGYELQSARPQEQQAINDALRPLVIVLVALGAFAFGATAVATGQVVQRNRDRWRSDDRRLRTIGMTRGQVRLAALASAGPLAVVAVATALLTMVLASPLAPVGPLHDLDPAQGFSIDGALAAAGTAAIVATIALLALAFSSTRTRLARRTSRPSPALATVPGKAATVAGLTLAVRAGDGRADDGRGRGWRALAATAAATAGLATCAVFVSSAITLTETPARYGFDADLVALNAYGDQSASALERAFGDREDVVAATGYITGSFLVDGRAVPGLATVPVKGELTPNLLRGRPPRSDDEIVVGQDTLETISADLGDVVPVQVVAAAGTDPQPAARSVGLRIVGVATFPPVSQVGTDTARLGTGALVTRQAFVRMGGGRANDPEFTAVRLVDGTDPAVVIAANRDRFQDAAQSSTAWFTDTKPAELLQLDAAKPYLRGALLLGFAILLTVIVHSLWARARANRHDLAVLRVIGCTRRQLDTVTAWQVSPFVLAAVLLGIPTGVGIGRLAFTQFAHSLSVVDDPSIPVGMLGALLLAVLLAAAIADLVAVAVARRSRTAVVLRQG
jgi:hypothetical protein